MRLPLRELLRDMTCVSKRKIVGRYVPKTLFAVAFSRGVRTRIVWRKNSDILYSCGEAIKLMIFIRTKNIVSPLHPRLPYRSQPPFFVVLCRFTTVHSVCTLTTRLDRRSSHVYSAGDFPPVMASENIIWCIRPRHWMCQRNRVN